MDAHKARGVVVLMIFLSSCQCIKCSVYWFIATSPAIFGQDVILTCDTGNPLFNSKDCPVRQWSGGPERKGLTYNGYSSNEEKYEELEDLSTSQFSLKIRNFSEADVMVNYTCSCGFDTYNQKLVLNDKKFLHNPTAVNVTFVTTNDVLQLHFECRKVYPVPNCSLSTGNGMVSSELSPTIIHIGMFYNLKYDGEFKLTKDNCDKIPVLKCEFCKPNCQHIEPIILSGDTYHCLGYREQNVTSGVTSLLEISTENEFGVKDIETANTEYIGIKAMAILLSVVFLALCVAGWYSCKQKRGTHALIPLTAQ